ncbi:MAG: DUF2934 domain-containing protein [Acidiphilium sp.]|nr:DUF2934 domain-containing protein [Acidiphilium sp.]
MTDHEIDNATDSETHKIAYRLWQEAGCPDGRDDEFCHQAVELIKNGISSKTTEDSFPASDPPSTTGMTGPIS